MNGRLSKKQLADAKYELTRSNTPLSRLGVSIPDLVAAPRIGVILREIPGGRSKALRAMRFSETDCIKKFLAKYDSISPTDAHKLPLEAIAIAAKVDIRHLWGEIMLAMREHSVNSVKVIAVAAHPDVIKKRVEFAMERGGSRDRDALDTMLGALPSPKGPTFINKFFAGGSQDESDGPKDVPEELVEDVEFVFPDVSVMQEKVQPMRQKMLAGK